MGDELSLYDADGTEFLLKNIGFVAAYDFQNEPTGPNAMTGSIGLGYTDDQQLNVGQDGFQYYTLPEVLENNHNTTSNAFSMWFETTGLDEDFAAKILFGGYVRNFYQKPLVALEVTKDSNWSDEEGGSGGQKIIVQLDEIIHKKKRIFDTCDQFQPVLLDTGSFSSYLPHDAFTKLADRMGAHDFVENGNRKIAVFDDCTTWDPDERIQFRFGTVDISVPIWGNLVRFVNDREVESSNYPTITDSKKQCLTHGRSLDPNFKLQANAAGQVSRHGLRLPPKISNLPYPRKV